ncbi:TatD family hydrolase [Algoriphagus aestuarii]|nr:TatD family hydrolase [Algoriphagus aestuarii]
MKLLDIHTHSTANNFAIFNLETSSPQRSPDYFSTGFHPWNLNENWQENFDKLEALAQNERCMAIGEAGFDRIWGPDISVQKAAFKAQAKLAIALGIPLILHLVKSHDLLLEYFKSEKETPSIICHGFNLKPHLATQLLPFPVYFSFGKALKQKESHAIAWLKDCPSERFFFETDDSKEPIDSIFNTASVILGRPEEVLSEQVLSNWNKISKRKIYE